MKITFVREEPINPPIKSVNIELTLDEARKLHTLLGNIGGGGGGLELYISRSHQFPDKEIRAVVDAIYFALPKLD